MELDFYEALKGLLLVVSGFGLGVAVREGSINAICGWCLSLALLLA